MTERQEILRCVLWGHSKSSGILLGYKITKKEKGSSSKRSKSSQVFFITLTKQYP